VQAPALSRAWLEVLSVSPAKQCYILPRNTCLAHSFPGGPRNIIPGILFFSALGGGVTFLSQQIQSRERKEKTSILSSKWSPLRPISDQEYVEILEQKILKIDAEIAIIDDNIALLKGAQQTAGSKDEPSDAAK
jgi:hypothetical protein